MAEVVPSEVDVADMKRPLAVPRVAPPGGAGGSGESETPAMLPIDQVKAVLKDLEGRWGDLENARFATVQAAPGPRASGSASRSPAAASGWQ